MAIVIMASFHSDRCLTLGGWLLCSCVCMSIHVSILLPAGQRQKRRLYSLNPCDLIDSISSDVHVCAHATSEHTFSPVFFYHFVQANLGHSSRTLKWNWRIIGTKPILELDIFGIFLDAAEFYHLWMTEYSTNCYRIV